jgi:hypothetical protein
VEVGLARPPPGREPGTAWVPTTVDRRGRAQGQERPQDAIQRATAIRAEASAQRTGIGLQTARRAAPGRSGRPNMRAPAACLVLPGCNHGQRKLGLRAVHAAGWRSHGASTYRTSGAAELDE